MEQTQLWLTDQAADNAETIKQMLNAPNDLIIRLAKLGTDGVCCAIVCIDGMADKMLVHEQIMKPVVTFFSGAEVTREDHILPILKDEVLTAFEMRQVCSFDDVLTPLLSGETVMLVDGSEQAIVIGSGGWKSRSIEEPLTESILRGPREGFTEDIRTNTALIRRRLRDPGLRLDTFIAGRRSKRTIILAYIEGIVHQELVQEATRRLQSIDIDDVDSSGTVEQWISDNFLSPFPLILNTERPDKVTGALLQGRLSVLVDGDPFVLILPITFSSSIQSPEDFSQNWIIATLTRILRLFAAFLATFLPGLYIALLEYHHGMIPSRLAFSIAGAREGVPFPAVVEAFAMEITLELLREAGIRLPKPIGQTIGIVGGLVIGEAAVSAGIVSPIMVIVVAITAIASFSFPSYSFAIALRMLRFGIMLAASVFGLYGIILAYIMINIHFVNVKSFGIPYSTPFAPLFFRDWKDLILRSPILFMNKRPQMMQSNNSTRLKKPKG